MSCDIVNLIANVLPSLQKVNRKSPPSQLRNLLSAKPSHSTSSSKAASQNVESTSIDEPDKSSRRSNRNSPDVARNNINEEAPFQTSSQTRPNYDDYSESCNYPSLRVKTDLEAPPDVKNEENDILMDPGDPDRTDKCQDFNASDLLEPKMEVMEQEASDEERSSFPPVYYNENNTLANPFANLQGLLFLLSFSRLPSRSMFFKITSCFSVQVIWISWVGSVRSYETRTPKVYMTLLFHLSLSLHYHTHTSTRTAAPPANQINYISNTNRRSRERAVSTRAVARSAGVRRRAARAASAPPRPSRGAPLLASLCCNPFDGPLPIRSGRVRCDLRPRSDPVAAPNLIDITHP